MFTWWCAMVLLLLLLLHCCCCCCCCMYVCVCVCRVDFPLGRLTENHQLLLSCAGGGGEGGGATLKTSEAACVCVWQLWDSLLSSTHVLHSMYVVCRVVRDDVCTSQSIIYSLSLLLPCCILLFFSARHSFIRCIWTSNYGIQLVS